VLLNEVVASQDGLITRSQALAAGMTVSAVRHAVRPDGPWQRLAPGLYASFTGRLTPRQRLRAALLHAGEQAVLSGADACRAHGLRYVPEQQRPLVLVPHSVHVSSSGLAVVQRSTQLLASRSVSGLPVAAIERAVIDTCLLTPSLQDTRALVCECVQRHLATPDRLAAQLDAARRNGSRHARIAVADVLAGPWSVPECELRDIIRSSRLLPEPHWNTPLPDLPDISPGGWWREARLVAEVDSSEYHDFGLGPEQTKRRYGRMVAAGWTVMPLAPMRIRREPRGLLRELEAAYRAGIDRWGHGLG